jgi:protease I
MSQKILIVTGDGGEGYEALYAYHRFQEAGYDPVVAAPSKRRLHLVLHDFEPGWDTYVERQGYGLESHITLEEIQPADYEAVLILGGRAPEFLRHHAGLISALKQFQAQGKWILSICHGIQVLVAAGLVEGRCVTCYEHVRSEVERAGGRFSEQQAVRDGKIISAQTWQSHPEFYREIFACLGNGKI